MSTLFPSNITVEKVTFTITNGESTPSVTEVTFTGSIQPVSAHELLALDIGRVNVGKIKIFSNDRLFVSRVDTNTPGDLVKWDGKVYEVIQENPYLNGLIQHYKYFAELRNDNYDGISQ